VSNRDWLVTDGGECIPLGGASLELADGTNSEPYRLYRFLTDLDDLLGREGDDLRRLQLIAPRVRRLLDDSEWILSSFSFPADDEIWSVQTIYDEPDYPITVQNVVWNPQSLSSIHSHGTWGIVALLDGEEENSFWQPAPTAAHPGRISSQGTHTLTTGDILCLMPGAIHQIRAIGDTPTISFNLYGATDFDRRREYDIEHHTATLF
jgi:predicted metal-dependent enzyme (double-stranded beta helix superfamily)